MRHSLQRRDTVRSALTSHVTDDAGHPLISPPSLSFLSPSGHPPEPNPLATSHTSPRGLTGAPPRWLSSPTRSPHHRRRDNHHLVSPRFPLRFPRHHVTQATYA